MSKSNSLWKSEEYIRTSCSCSWLQILPFLSSGCNFVYSIISPSLHGSPLTVRGHISVWGSRALIISDIWTPQMAHPPKIAHKVNKSKTNKFSIAYGTLPKKETQQTNLGEKGMIENDWANYKSSLWLISRGEILLSCLECISTNWRHFTFRFPSTLFTLFTSSNY